MKRPLIERVLDHVNDITFAGIFIAVYAVCILSRGMWLEVLGAGAVAGVVTAGVLYAVWHK